MKTLFCGTDDVNGDRTLEVWTNGSGDLHVLIESDTGSHSIYIRKGLELGKAIVRELWL